MTPEILTWLFQLRNRYTFNPGRVLEIGAQDFNGSVRPLFHDAIDYVACDMELGKGVDRIVKNSEILHTFGFHSFDTVIACETLEHDISFWETVKQMHEVLEPGGHMIITTPRFGFPEHRYPKHYVNFGEDAYRDIFFEGLDIINISVLDNVYAPQISLAGLARKRTIEETLI